MKIDAKTIKLRLKRFIEENPKINQTHIALELRLSKSHISQILDNKRKGDIDLLIKIAETAGTSLAELLVDEPIHDNLKQVECVSEPIEPYTSEIDDLLNKARAVLESGTHWGGSLKSNILSFHTGFESDKAKLPMDHGEKHKAG